MEQPSTVMLNADYGDVERRAAANSARRSRGMGLLGMLAALSGMEIEGLMDKLVGSAVAQGERIHRETAAINRINRQLTGTRGGTGACGECGKTISANKEYCFAHLESSSRTPKQLAPTDVQPGWNESEWQRLHEKIRKTMEANGVAAKVREPGTGKGVEMSEDFDAPMDDDAADPDGPYSHLDVNECASAADAIQQELEDHPNDSSTYACGAQYCDDPVCTTHGGLGE